MVCHGQRHVRCDRNKPQLVTFDADPTCHDNANDSYLDLIPAVCPDLSPAVLSCGPAPRIYTTPMTFFFVDIPASIFFGGAMKSVTTNYTILTVSLPVIGTHSVTVRRFFIVGQVRAKS